VASARRGLLYRAPTMTAPTKNPWSVFAAFSAALVALLVSGAAFASGSFKLRTPTIQEVSGGWHVYCDIALAKAPAIAHPTIKFKFTKTMVYERDLVDGKADPIVNPTPLVGQNPSIESLEVDFSNASGQIYPRTRFDFSLTRTRGYEAGEYKLSIETSDGTDIGSPTTIILKGDNPVVDRRAMSFDAKNPNMKKVAGIDGGGAPKVDDSVAAAPLNGDVSPAGSAPPFLGAAAFQKQPEEMQEHPKGCGCSVVGLREDGAPIGLLCFGLGVALLATRRRA
jgi:hypothetical protein